MSRRNITISKHPDLKASEEELAVLEAAKNTSQGEVLSIAANKKQLEEDFEAAKKRLDEELTLKRAAHAKEMDEMEQKHRNMEMAVITMESVQAMMKEQTATREQVRDSVKKDIADLHDEKVKEKAEVTRLQILVHNLGDSIKDARTDYKELEEKIAPLQKELSILQGKIKDSTEKYSDLSDSVAAYHSEINELDTRKRKDTSILEQLSKEISDKTKQKVDLDIELVDAQKKLSEVKQQAAAVEADANTRAGNAARLEVHVDGKLEHLKELESHFTVEHLARGGYKKTE